PPWYDPWYDPCSASATPSLEDSSASATSSLEDSSASSTPTCDSTPVPTPAARTKLAPPTAPPTAAAVRPSRRSVATPTPSLSSSCVSSSVSSSPAPSGSSSTSLDHASLSASTSSITTSSSTSSVRVERSVQPPPVQPPPVQPPPVQPPPHREERHLRRSGVAGEEKESVELRRDVLQNNRHSAVARLPKGEAPSQDLPEEEALSLGSSSSSLPDQGYAASEGMGEVEEAGLVGSSWETRPTSPDETLNRPKRTSRTLLMDMSLREHEKDLTAQLNTALEADLEGTYISRVNLVSEKTCVSSSDHNQPLVSMVDLVPITAIDEVLECYGTTVPDTDPKTQGWSTFSTDPNMVGPSGDDRHNRNNNACSRRDLTVADVPVYRPHLTNHILSSYSTSVSQSKITRDAPSRFGLKTFTVVPPKHSSPVGMFAGTMSAGAIKIDERGNMVQTGLGHKSGTSAGSESGAGEGTAKAFWSSSERRDKVNDKYRDQKIVYPVSPETTRNPKRLEDLKNRHAKNREPSLVVQPQEEDNGTEGRKRRESKPILSEEPQPRCEPANRFPPNTQRDLSFLKPTRRTSSQYVASAISRYAKADSEAGTLRTNTAMSFQKGGRSVQVVPRRSTQTFSDPQKVPVGGSGPPGRFASITQETTEGEVGLERGGRLVGSLCFTALDPEPWPEVTVFGPVKKFKQVLSKPVQQEACLHTVLMEAIQTGGKDRLKKTRSQAAEELQGNPAVSREAMLEAIRSGSAVGKLKKITSPVKTLQVNGRLGTIGVGSVTHQDMSSFGSGRDMSSIGSAVCGAHCLSVTILNADPCHVIPGSALVLRARIDQEPPETVATVTWEREPETGDARGRVVLASCSAGGLACPGHMTLDMQATSLRVDSFNGDDRGVYSLTVTGRSGVRTTAYCVVREYEPVHHVSVGVNVSVSSLVCTEAWGTDPVFSWLHERAAVTAVVGRVSADGKTLAVSHSPLCGHFTCMVSNKLGYSSATYSADPCEAPESKGPTVVVVCVVLLLLLAMGLATLLWWRRRIFHHRGECLHDLLDNM
ncbi:hypothetical protein NHX12_001977, partial [Muraenolepis orangiensis]